MKVNITGTNITDDGVLAHAIRNELRQREPEVLQREVAVRLQSDGDGRTLEARLVPYNEIATVSDGGDPYQETFLPGAFNAQMNATHRIKAFLNFRHRQSLADAIGHVTRIEDRDDGLHGEMRVLDVPDGDKALKYIHAGVLDRLSIEFVPEKTRVVKGVTERVKARLLGVALVPEGAYTGAEVLAVREQEDDPPDLGIAAAYRLPQFDAGLAESLASRGIHVPDRFMPVPEPDANNDEEN